MVNIRIQGPRRRSVLTALNDWEPPDTCITASVRPYVGRMPFIEWQVIALSLHDAGDLASRSGCTTPSSFRPKRMFAQSCTAG